MANEAMISILMANYNKAEYITTAIESILAQTFGNWELLIIDDNSSDNSSLVIKKFLFDNRIKFFKNPENIGKTRSLKEIIEKAGGEIIVEVDSDDFIEKNALELIFKTYEDNPDLGYVYSQCWFCDANLNPVHLGYCAAIPEGKTNLHVNSVVAMRTFKKEAYFKTTGFDEEILYAEDLDLTFKMEEVTKLYFLDKPLYYYRVLTKSQTHGFKNEHINRSSTALAKYKAYKRRIGTKIPNLRKEEVGAVLFYGIISSFLVRRFKLGFYFIIEFLKDFKAVILNFYFYWYLLKKLGKYFKLEYAKKFSR